MNRISTLAFSFLLGAGCGGSVSSTVPLDAPLRMSGDAPGVGSVRAHLTSDWGAVPGGGPVVESVETSSAGTRAPAESELAIAPGRTTFVMSRGAVARLEHVTVALGDLHLEGGALPPAGVELADLSLELEQPVGIDVAHATGDLLAVSGSAMFALHWKLVLDDGSRHPLGPIEIGPLEVHAAARRDVNDEVQLELELFCSGVCADMPGLFQLSDGILDVGIPLAVQAK
jgi:hypothetical protein